MIGAAMMVVGCCGGPCEIFAPLVPSGCSVENSPNMNWALVPSLSCVADGRCSATGAAGAGAGAAGLVRSILSCSIFVATAPWRVQRLSMTARCFLLGTRPYAGSAVTDLQMPYCVSETYLCP